MGISVPLGQRGCQIEPSYLVGMFFSGVLRKHVAEQNSRSNLKMVYNSIFCVSPDYYTYISHSALLNIKLVSFINLSPRMLSLKAL